MDILPELLDTLFIAKPWVDPWPARFFILSVSNPVSPGERRADDPTHMELRKALSRAGQWRQVITVASSDWKHRKPGFAVAGMDLAEAVALARSFNLNTVFAVEDDWVSVIDCGDGSRTPLGRFSARLHAPEDEPRFWVYVIRLADAVLQVKRFQDANPGHRPGQPCYYVGMTGLSPEERFANHKAGHKACGLVRDHGLDLDRGFVVVQSRLSHSKAVALEVGLAARLRKEGHAVWQK